METYENSHFGVRIDFPENWKVVSWKYAKIDRGSRPLYQARDDELPPKPGASKFLFTARLPARKSAALVEADIELSIFRAAAGEDLGRQILENFERQRKMYQTSGIQTSIDKPAGWTIGETLFDCVDQENRSSGRRSRYRFFFRRCPENQDLWLYGKIAGHNERAFRAAIKIVEAMQCGGPRRRGSG